MHFSWNFVRKLIATASVLVAFVSVENPALGQELESNHKIKFDPQPGASQMTKAGVSGLATANKVRITPSSPTVYDQRYFVLTAVVDGSGPFTYQWFRLGKLVPGETNSSIRDVAVYTKTYAVEVRTSEGLYGKDSTVVTVVEPPPTNDNFADAHRLNSYGEWLDAGIGYASLEAGEMDLGVSGQSVWYVWTAPKTGNMLLSLEDADAGFIAAVFTGDSVTNLTLIAKADHGQKVEIQVIGDTEYHMGLYFDRNINGSLISPFPFIFQEFHLNAGKYINYGRPDLDYYQFSVTGPVGTKYQVEESSDLIKWTVKETGTLSKTGQYLLSSGAALSPRFFRATTK